MVEFDPVLGVIVVGVIGFLMWAFTNYHLWNGILGIKADIDEKREGTEEFVKDQLQILKVELRKELGGDKLEKGLQARFEGLQATFSEELKDLEGRLATVQIDTRPLLEQVTAELLPSITEKVENVKSSILGKLGYGTKALKAAAEGVVEVVGERAVQEAGIAGDWKVRLAKYGLDDEWMKAHKTAAVGFELIMEAMSAGQPVQIAQGVPAGAKRIGPPEGFG